ncbi:MAG TPA: DNA repair protein RadA, partial [Hyphomonas sp.]|nr:DNA repair protein RadA [Hyphomonas sp.]
FFGEVALSGAVRAAPRMDQRMKEAARLGFQQAFGPEHSPAADGGLTLTPIARLIALVDLLAPDAANA